MADRYTYLPLIGIFIILAWAVPDRVFANKTAVRRRSPDRAGLETAGLRCPGLGGRPSVETCAGSETLAQRVLPGAPGQITTATAIALLGASAVLCRLQVRYWESTDTLFRHALQVTKDNWIAHYNLGFSLAQAGNIPEALQHFEEAVRIKPDYADAQYNLGRALILQGRPTEAVDHWEQALRVKPGDTETQNDLARLLATLPRSEGGDSVRAVTLAERACQVTSNRVAKYLDTLAIAYASAGRFDDAIATGQKAFELARAAGQWQLAGEIESRLEMYRSGRASTTK